MACAMTAGFWWARPLSSGASRGRPSQAHPQLGGSRIPFPGGGAVLVGELQRSTQRMSCTCGHAPTVPIAEGPAVPGPFRLMASVRARRPLHPPHSSSKRRRQVVAMQPAGQLPEDGCLGSVATPSITSCCGPREGAVARSSAATGAPGHSRRRRGEGRVPLGYMACLCSAIDSSIRKFGEVARQGRALAGRRGHEAKDT